MGISLKELTRLFKDPRLHQRPLRVLDIGSQNLHGASVAQILVFLRAHHPRFDKDAMLDYARALSLGADVHPEFGGLNGAWLGDLLERIGIDYLSYDIFNGFKTQIFDLNVEELPPSLRGQFDLVLNCGTTEHVLNQFNSFRVIHDAVKVGGLIYHALPMTGYLDHGYFNYNPRLFFDLATANQYAIRKFSYGGPDKGPRGLDGMLEKLVGPYRSLIDDKLAERLDANWAGRQIPTVNISVVLEKIRSQPFRTSLELSTTVGSVATAVGLSEPEQHALGELDAIEHAMLDKLRSGDSVVDVAAISDLARNLGKIAVRRSVSPALETYALEEYIRRDPSREDLKNRLRQLQTMTTAAHPLLRFADPEDGIDPMVILMDGREQAVLEMTADRDRFAYAIAAEGSRRVLLKKGRTHFDKPGIQHVVGTWKRDEVAMRLRKRQVQGSEHALPLRVTEDDDIRVPLDQPRDHFDTVVVGGVVDDDDLIGRTRLPQRRPDRALQKFGMIVVGHQKRNGRPAHVPIAPTLSLCKGTAKTAWPIIPCGRHRRRVCAAIR